MRDGRQKFVFDSVGCFGLAARHPLLRQQAFAIFFRFLLRRYIDAVNENAGNRSVTCNNGLKDEIDEYFGQRSVRLTLDLNKNAMTDVRLAGLVNASEQFDETLCSKLWKRFALRFDPSTSARRQSAQKPD